MKMNAIRLLSSGCSLLLLFAILGCDVDVEEPGEMPNVDVSGDPGEMPEMDVEGPEVDAEMKTKEVEVPDVDVDTETKEVEVPDVDVSVPEEPQADSEEPKNEQASDGK